MFLSICHFLSAHGASKFVASVREFIYKNSTHIAWKTYISDIPGYIGWAEHRTLGVIAFITDSGKLQYEW